MEGLSGFLPLLVVGVIAYLVIRWAVGRGRAEPEWYCRTCGSTGKPKQRLGGNGVIELLLYLFFIIPGLAYSAWRGTHRIRVCSECGSRELIPANSPMARKIRGVERQEEEFMEAMVSAGNRR